MDQDSSRVFELNELIRFYAQVASTEGMEASVVESCNRVLEKLLNAVKPLIDKQTAKIAGIITG